MKKNADVIEGDVRAWADRYINAYNEIDSAVADALRLLEEIGREPGMQAFWTSTQEEPGTPEQEAVHALFWGVKELAEGAKRALDASMHETDKDGSLTPYM